jgi:PAS domain S-box-containing protein
MPSDDEAGGSFDSGPWQVLDAAPDAIVVVGSDGLMEFANAQTEAVFGYPRAELVGKPLEKLIPDRFRPTHAAHVSRFRANPRTRSMGSGLDLFGRHRDGTDIPVEVSLSSIRSASGTTLICAAIRDVTERRRIESAAKLNASRLASAVETIEDAFALFDSSDRLVLCNSVYRGLLGDATGPVVGQSYEELVDVWMNDLAFESAEDRARFREERLAGRSDPKGAFEVRTRDGRTLRVMDRRTVEGGIVKTIWDLTEDKRAAADLREARTAAETASAAKSEFLSSMSHELRTPLNAILGFAQLLERDRKEPLSNRHKERTEQILRGGEHLLHLIDDILDLSRVEAGNISISKEPVSVADVLGVALRTLEPMAARASVSVKVAPVAADLPMVTCDRTRFAQIVMNFVSNAIKYNRPGGSVTVSVSREADGRVRVTVTDTGIGIPENKQDKLFQPFQRAGQETGPIEGTGIGLVISKRLAELMDGRVGFRSVAGEGSEFWLDFPAQLRQTGRPAAPSKPNPGSVTALDGQSGRLVLYVEDNPANVSFIRDVLSDFDGIELATAPTAEMGIALARARRPDLVIMDINLPGISGLEALVALRGFPETAAIPVIALTAAASERDKQRGREAGFFRYLTKPVKVDELVDALETLLTR